MFFSHATCDVYLCVLFYLRVLIKLTTVKKNKWFRIMCPFAVLSARGETEGRSNFSKCLTSLGMMAQGITGGISGNPRM